MPTASTVACLARPTKSSATTMVRTRRYKLVNYHGHGAGELFDMRKDLGEFNNLWDDPDHRKIKMDLMIKSYDLTVRTTHVGTRLTGRY